MNLDLLIKLIKLANHNNTEGEANVAARKVCKMIEGDEFKCLDQTTVSIKPNTTTYTSKPPNPTRPPSNPYYSPSDDQWSFYERFTQSSERYGYYNPFTDKRKSSKSESRKLKCTKCGIEKNTKFVCAPELFVCNDCQWTEYTRKKEPAYKCNRPGKDCFMRKTCDQYNKCMSIFWGEYESSPN